MILFCENATVAAVDVDRGEYQSSTEIQLMLKRGFLLNWISSNCSLCQISGGKCGFDFDIFHFRCFCPDSPHAWHCVHAGENKRLPTRVSIGVGVSSVFATIVIASLGCYYCFARKRGMMKPENKVVEAFILHHHSLMPRRFSYSDIKKMTNSFTYKLGQGGFGSVYRGNLSGGRLVAVKLLLESIGDGEEFINEVASISRTSHVNIVTLLGFCYERTKRALVYEFMPNGSLDKFIFHQDDEKTCRLEQNTLSEIAIGIARGLEYLHRGCNTRIVHFDIKPHNILLDEDLRPKISDFGLSKLCRGKESIVSMFGARGTAGYIAPEVFMRGYGGVSYKSDVYSYGMMILEMFAGKDHIDGNEGTDSTSSEVYFPDSVYQYLENIMMLDEEEETVRKKMIIVGLWCIQTSPRNRPSMTKVIEMLEGSIELLHIPPKPLLFSSTKPTEFSSSSIFLKSEFDEDEVLPLSEPEFALN